MKEVKKYTVFFDFDNTISTCDVIDDMLERFSKDKQWLVFEKKWQEGIIGSRDCLSRQIKGIRITKKELDEYLSGIELDPYFKKIIKFLDSKGIKAVVLSDNFGYALRRILRNNGIRNLKIYSNRAEITNGGIKPFFPFGNKRCRVCAHCKKDNLLANTGKDSLAVYIGDGLSDICPAQHADVVFAKGALLKNLKKERFPCIQYKTLQDVYDILKRGDIWKKSKNRTWTMPQSRL